MARLSILIISTLAAVTHAVNPTATISNGVLVGTTTVLPTVATTVNKYLGIPFAASPIRFDLPATPSPWTTPRTAQTFGNACYQQAGDMTILAPQSEDCLYLNVFAPATATTTSKLSVMVWIHGGGLKAGSAAIAHYDGSSFAANQDVIVVSINYRLNAFGFPGSPTLPLTQRNVGFYDQRLALQWVQQNIAAFGGDPTKVTIFGESSGASSVDRLITTYNSTNAPFRGAIMESGSYSLSPGDGVAPAITWTDLAVAVGCNATASMDQLKCVRAVPALTIYKLVNASTWNFLPVNDGVTQLANPEARRLAGQIAKVPIITGNNADEGTLFTLGVQKLSGFISAHSQFNKFYEAIYNAYLPYGDNQTGAAKLWTNAYYQCPAANISRDTALVDAPAWRYYFNISFPDNVFAPGFGSLGVYHTSEIPYVFGTYNATSASAPEKALSAYLQTAWANFAKNPTTGPGWTAVNPTNPQVAVIGRSGNTFADATMVPFSSLDGACPVLDQLYEELLLPIY